MLIMIFVHCLLKYLLNKNYIIIFCIIQLSECESISNDQIKYFNFLNNSLYPDIDRNATQLIESRGFIPETHNVVTEDGYILKLFRIINPYLKSNPNLKPILLMHGLFGNSDIFLLYSTGKIHSNGIYIENGNLETLSCDGLNPNKVGNNLGFVLAACGYDVWLGNYRGNRYSDGHMFLHPKTDVNFWKFSYDEISQYDLPANVKYILKVTKESKIAYIGHSMGCTLAFARLAEDPSFEEYLKPCIMLGPATYVRDMKGAFRYILELFAPFLSHIHGVIFQKNILMENYSRYFCGTIGQYFCTLIYMNLMGHDFQYLNMSRVPIFFSRYLDGTSYDNIAHLSQEIRSKRFRKYDYGSEGNIIKYGQMTPPDYPLYNITSKNIALFYGGNDWVTTVEDVESLKHELKVPLLNDYPIPEFNHYDFLFSDAAGRLSNSRILQILNLF